MTVKNFWRVFLKGLGLWMAVESIALTLNYISAMTPVYADFAGYSVMSALFLLGISLGIVYLILRYSLGKTDWLIDKLKLEKGFNEEKLDISISAHSMLAIIIAVIGGLSFISAVPDFLRSLYSFYQQEYIFRQSPDASRIIYAFVKSLVGFVLMTNGGYFSQLLSKQPAEEGENPSLPDANQNGES